MRTRKMEPVVAGDRDARRVANLAVKRGDPELAESIDGLPTRLNCDHIRDEALARIAIAKEDYSLAATIASPHERAWALYQIGKRSDNLVTVRSAWRSLNEGTHRDYKQEVASRVRKMEKKRKQKTPALAGSVPAIPRTAS